MTDDNKSSKHLGEVLFERMEQADRQLANDPSLTPEQRAFFQREISGNGVFKNIDTHKFAEAAKVIDRHEILRREQAIQKERALRNNKTIFQKLHGQPKATKIYIVFSCFWTAYVLFRTSTDHEIFGTYLNQWPPADFFTNWLALPAIAFALLKSFQWINGK